MPDTNPMQQPTQVIPMVLNQRYELREILGEGGMGRVYKAFDKVLGRIVAVKVAANTDSLPILQRFEREAQTLSQLNHPNLAAVHDFGVDGSFPYMVMEFIEGKSLAQLIFETKSLSLERAMPIIRQIAEGLRFAHEKGIVHRDIKPDNILVSTKDGKDWVELVDFGLSVSRKRVATEERLTVPGHTVGTWRYMAPEQMEGKEATTASDIYSFGLVCAEILGGVDCVKSGRLCSSPHFSSTLMPLWNVFERACHEIATERWENIGAMTEALEKEAAKIPMAAKTIQIEVEEKPRQIFSEWGKRFFKRAGIGALCLGLGWFGVNFFRSNTSFSSTRGVMVSMAKVQIKQLPKDEIEVTVKGEIHDSTKKRLILEVAVCDENGTRIPSANSVLEDHALGALQALDLTLPTQCFERTFRFHIPPGVSNGYASATLFDSNHQLVGVENSACWKVKE